MELNIQASTANQATVIRVSGEVDISNAARLREAIDEALAQPADALELDFSQVSYIDSTGIGVLVGAAHHAAEQERPLRVTHAQPGVMRVATLLGVDREIDISA